MEKAIKERYALKRFRIYLLILKNKIKTLQTVGDNTIFIVFISASLYDSKAPKLAWR
jgi:hypothetical protein